MGIPGMNDDRMQRFSEIIIEHSQFPRFHEKMKEPTHQGQGENPFCGDRIKLQFAVNEAGVIERAAVESAGCAISTASGSLLAAHIHGITLQQAEELFEQVRALITGGSDQDPHDELGELAALAFVRRYPSRVKCAALPWHVLKHALKEDQSVATTE